MLVLSFATYQANAPLAVAGAAAVLVFKLESMSECGSEKDKKQYWRWPLFFALILIVSYIIYTIVSRAFFWSSSYLDSQIFWEVDTKRECVHHIIDYIRSVLLAQTPGSSLLLLFGIAFSFVGKLLYSRKSVARYPFLLSWLCYLTACIAPFLLSVYMGGAVTPRAQFAAPYVGAFLLLYALNRFDIQGFKLGVFVILVGGAAFLMGDVSANYRSFYTDDIRYQQELGYTANLLDDIRQVHSNLSGTPIVFIGKWTAPLNNACLRESLWGQNNFAFGYNANDPSSNTLRCLEFISAAWGVEFAEPSYDQRANAIELAETMQSYPNDGSIIYQDGVIVVKLST